MSARTTTAKPKRKPRPAPSQPSNGSQPGRMHDLTPIHNHPLAPLFGSFDDEPLWDEWMDEIRKYREQMNALEDETQ